MLLGVIPLEISDHSLIIYAILKFRCIKLLCHCPFSGAAYASSSANVLPPSTFPPTIASFGFINQPTAGDASFALAVSDSLTAGRGCPVGDAAADRSPVLIPSPQGQLNELQDPTSSPYPLHFQASSTPMVTQVLLSYDF